MLDIIKILHVVSESHQSRLTDEDIQKVLYILEWQREILKKAQAEPSHALQPSVQKLSDYLSCSASGDSIARMYATRMLTEIKLEWLVFENIDQWLLCIDYVTRRAPEPEQAFPMSKLFVFFMYSPSGAALFRMPEFNVLLTDVLETWCDYLDSAASRSVLNPTGNIPATDGWLSESGLCLDQYENYQYKDQDKYWKFTSYNDFFHRQIDLATYRPLDGDNDDSVIVSANDGTVYSMTNDVKRCSNFWAKGQPHSLIDMLGGNTNNPTPTDPAIIDDFEGGDVLQSFLDGSDYHRWHAPISGTVIKAQVIKGLTFSELRSEGLDLSAGTESQGYQAMVNARGLIIIDNPNIGKVAVIPIGITEISSITINVSEQQEVTKGQELGWFSYGGSSMALVFENGMIETFTAQVVTPPSSPPCKKTDNCSADQGCLRVRAQVASARLKTT